MSYTLEQIAQLAGVSRSTVSRVINNHPHVRAEVREKVEQVINQVGYQPHAAARSLVTNRTQIIGLIVPRSVATIFTDPFFPLLIHGIVDACNLHHYLMLLSLFNNREEEEELYRRVLRSGHLDGVIVASTMLDDPMVRRLLADHVPFVLVGRYPDDRVNYVDADNVNGARLATEHLLRLGHRRVATITGPYNMVVGQDRLAGYRQALAAWDIAAAEELVAEGDFTEEGARIAMLRLLRHKPTAVFAASDTMAIGAMKAIREVGLLIPADIAVVGFDDLPIATIVGPPLTTVRQPIARLASAAVSILINLIEHKESITQKAILPTELVIRASCGTK